MTWKASKAVVSRCASALAWCRAFVEQYARAAACRVSDMYAAGVDPEHAAAYLRSHAVDMVHYAHHAKE